jgi:hypothetical protein
MGAMNKHRRFLGVGQQGIAWFVLPDGDAISAALFAARLTLLRVSNDRDRQVAFRRPNWPNDAEPDIITRLWPGPNFPRMQFGNPRAAFPDAAGNATAERRGKAEMPLQAASGASRTS